MRSILISSLFLAILMAWLLPNAAVADDDSLNVSASASVKGALSRASYNRLVEEYQLAIEDIELHEGAYGPQLSQQLFNLGDIHQQFGKHQLALESFKKALHLNRINEGLYTKGQIPIVERMISSLAAQNSWKDVGEKYAYLTWLYERNFQQQDVEMIDITMKIAKWHLQAYASGQFEEPMIDLVKCYNAYHQALELVRANYGDTDPRILEPLQGLLLANYLVSTGISSTNNSVIVGNNGDTPAQLKAISTKLQGLRSRSFYSGQQLIRAEIVVNEQQQSVDHLAVTRSMLKLGDWYLMYGRKAQAMEQYQTAYQYLNDHVVDQAIVAQVFNQPVVLPDFPNMTNNSSMTMTNAAIPDGVDYVHASMDITAYGKARNVQIVSSNPSDGTRMRSKVLRSIRDTKFRPRLTDGEPVFTEQMQLHVFP